MKQIKDISIILIFTSLIALGNFLLNPNKPNLSLKKNEVNLKTITRLGTPLILIDARSPKEFKTSHIERAINLSIEVFDEKLEEFLEVWTPSSQVVVYCNSNTCNLSCLNPIF